MAGTPAVAERHEEREGSPGKGPSTWKIFFIVSSQEQTSDDGNSSFLRMLIISFHQVKLSKCSQELTTLITPFRRYCFQSLPFGIRSVPEYFQKQMSCILEGEEGVANVIGDILVFGRTQAEHDHRLQQVLRRLKAAGDKLNRSKCVFSTREVRFLGVVSDKGISPDPEKTKALANLEAPTDVSGVQRLLGMANHLGHFLPHLPGVMAPIRALLQKGSVWVWDV